VLDFRMAKYTFHGRVLPTFMEFTMIGSLTSHWEDDIGGPVKQIVDASVSITKGIIEIVCESNLFGTDNYDGHVDLKTNYLAKAVINCYGFAKGMLLHAVLETVIKPDGIKYNIKPHRPNLEPLVTALHSSSDGGVNIQPVLSTVMTNPTIFVAVKDLVEGISATETPVNCARAIEAIRESMAPANDRKTGWQMMRDNLNVSQHFLEFITDTSKGPRHGAVLGISFPAINETIKRSWIVMNRFLEFKNRGGQQLPLSDFPLLDG
jgi:hypothetical protein